MLPKPTPFAGGRPSAARGGLPRNTLSRQEIEEKARKFCDYGGGATPEELRWVITRAWNLENESHARDLLPGGTDDTQLSAHEAERRNGS